MKVEANLQKETELNTPQSETIRNTLIEGSSEYNEAIQTSIDVSRALCNDVDIVEREWFQRIENMKAEDNRVMIALERKLDTELKRRNEYTNICKSTLFVDNELALINVTRFRALSDWSGLEFLMKVTSNLCSIRYHFIPVDYA